jgi:hypothetical protein
MNACIWVILAAIVTPNAVSERQQQQLADHGQEQHRVVRHARRARQGEDDDPRSLLNLISSRYQTMRTARRSCLIPRSGTETRIAAVTGSTSSAGVS